MRASDWRVSGPISRGGKSVLVAIALTSFPSEVFTREGEREIRAGWRPIEGTGGRSPVNTYESARTVMGDR